MDQLKAGSANSIPLTPLGFLGRAATIYGDCPSVIYNTKTYTWSETNDRCIRVSSSLVSLGIKRGEVVSVVAPNVPAMYEAQFAIPMAGAVINTINLRLDARTVSILLHHSESKLVLVDYQSAALVLEAFSLFPSNSPRPMLVLITEDDDDDSFSSDFVSSYEKLVKDGDSGFKWLRPNSDYDPIVLNYTSGTTSAPKGAVHCHKGIFTITVDSLIEWSVPKEPVFLWTVPMFHTNGWSFSWGMAAAGGTNICLRRFDAAEVYSAIRRHKVTHMCGAPVVLNMISSYPMTEALENPVHIMTSGSPPPAAVLSKTEALGFVVSHAYGLTETAGIVVSCTWKKNWNKLELTERVRLKARQGVGTIGMAAVDVVDPETGESVKRDGKTRGEIVLKGACVMLGYLKDPEATSKAIRENGWFYTGDVAVMHSDGYLEIKDRSKDVIISGGENLSSVEVESALYLHPAVNEAAVVARPDEFWGETPCAFVSLKSDVKVEEKDLIEFCRAKLPKYMVPKTVVFQEELPKTCTGKIQKFVLREMAKNLSDL